MFVQLRSIEFAFPLIKTRNNQSDLIIREILDPTVVQGRVIHLRNELPWSWWFKIFIAANVVSWYWDEPSLN